MTITLQVLRAQRQFVDDGSDIGTLLKTVGVLPAKEVREYTTERREAANPRWRTVLHHSFAGAGAGAFILFMLGILEVGIRFDNDGLWAPFGLFLGALLCGGMWLFTNPIEWGVWSLDWWYHPGQIPPDVRKRILGPTWEIQPNAQFGVQRLNIGYFNERDHARAILVLFDKAGRYREIDFFCDDKELVAA